MKSAETISRFKDTRWYQRRKFEENVQQSIIRWWNLHWRELGVSSPKVLQAFSAWLGKPAGNPFMILGQLHKLGYDSGGAQLMLAAPRNGCPGMFLWIAELGSREPEEVKQMKVALTAEGFHTITARSAESAVRIITEYLDVVPAPGASQ